ncbi:MULTISPECIES: hypothetical protein [Streptomyces]|uniref:hypothetical protein n=1 Tax=Streptomyces TaxID=1883 RepID=UPI0018DF225C|nr:MULTISPECIES: hypothetical protein [Streptomyces]MCZ4102468.1 hypothetical protein [Streptomyces sp. H39-C1]
MAVWGLVMETTVGLGERKHTEASVMQHVEGSRQEALAELEARARRHEPEHPRSPQRRRLFRTCDGLLLVVDGTWQSFSTRFTLAELVEDSAAPVPTATPEPQPEPVDAQLPESEGTTPPVVGDSSPVERYNDGVPVKPSWLGRTDLA